MSDKGLEQWVREGYMEKKVSYDSNSWTIFCGSKS